MNHWMLSQKWLAVFQSRTWRLWFQGMIIFGVLLSSVILPAMVSHYRMQQLLLLMVGLMGIAFLIQWPALGLIGILFGSHFIPYSGPGGINAVILGVAGMVVLWIADMVIRQGRIQFVEPRTARAVFAFIGSAFLSFLVGQLSWQPLAAHAPIVTQAGGLAIFVLSGLAFLIQGHLLDHLRWLKAFTWLFIGIGVIYIVARLFPSAANVLRYVLVRSSFTGSLFWVWLLVIPFSQALLNRQLSVFWRIVLFVFVFAVLYVSIVQAGSWKSGYIPPLIGAAVVIVLRFRRHAIWLIPIFLFGGWLLMSQAVASDEYSTLTRFEAWKIVFQLSKVSPVFGMGFANYYWYTPMIPINGWFVNFSSHNQYVDIFSQTGLIGLVCFFWVFWEIGRLGWNLRDKAPEGFAQAYVYGALGGLAGTLAAGMFADWILPFAYNIGMEGVRSSFLSWFFLGGIVAIRQMVEKNRISEISDALSGGKNE